MPTKELTVGGESAIISGAGRGIGMSVARQFTEMGIDVVINDIDGGRLSRAQDELRAFAGDVIIVQGDVSDPDVTSKIVDQAVNEFDGIDIVINNVGIGGPTSPCENISSDEFTKTLDINLGSHFNSIRSAIPHLKNSVDPRIVNISSISGKKPLVNRTPYTTSKMGLIGMTRTLAAELAEYEVNVNAVCPGAVRGERLEKNIFPKRAAERDVSVEKIRQEMIEAAPLETMIDPEDIADTVLFLCSESSKKITGQDLNVTAGRVMY